MTVADDKPIRKRLTAASKERMDVPVGSFVRLQFHRGVGIVQGLDETALWARVRWLTGEKAGRFTDHPLASLRKAERPGSHNLDARH